MKYVGISNINSKFKKQNNIKKREMHWLSCCIICLIVFSCLITSSNQNFQISNFISRVTSRWTPKVDDFGKIKFVNFSFDKTNKSDGIFIVNSPFKNYLVKNKTQTCLEVSGLGDIVVLSPIDGVVQDIDFSNQKYCLFISSGNVIVELKNIDYCCVSVGQKIKAQDRVAISMESTVDFSIICDGEYVQLPAGETGDTFFE